MTVPEPSMIETFTARAEAAAATVSHVHSLDQAFRDVVRICAEKEACAPLASGCEYPLSGAAEDLCALKEWSKVMAAPGLEPSEMDRLVPLCRDQSIKLIQDGLHRHLGGIDVGLTWAGHGIAQTGTVVVDSSREDVRLAGMISEIHVVLLPASAIVPDTSALTGSLRTAFGSPPDYTAFITGPSRTADIERVLTLGVHGPLETHIYLLQT